MSGCGKHGCPPTGAAATPDAGQRRSYRSAGDARRCGNGGSPDGEQGAGRSAEPTRLGSWGGPLSALRLPAAPGHTAWEARDAAEDGCWRVLAQRGWGRSAMSGSSQRSAAAAAVCVPISTRRAAAGDLLDGHYWARHMSVFGPLDAMTARGELPPALYLLVLRWTGDARHGAALRVILVGLAGGAAAATTNNKAVQRAARRHAGGGPELWRPGRALRCAALAERFGMVLSQSVRSGRSPANWRRWRHRSADENGDASAGGWRAVATAWALEAGCRSSWRPAATRRTWRPRAAPCRRRCTRAGHCGLRRISRRARLVVLARRSAGRPGRTTEFKNLRRTPHHGHENV